MSRKANDSMPLMSPLVLIKLLDELIFYLHPLRDDQLLFRSKKEESYYRKYKIKNSASVCTCNLRGEK